MRLQNGEGGKIMHKFKKLVSKKVDGKNYYSILYFDETDGEIHQGFSSGSLDVISDFLKEFFINNNTERHAHWIIKYDMGEPVGAICSNCKSEIGYDRNGYFSEMDELYCHNCGCKMDEVVSDDT